MALSEQTHEGLSTTDAEFRGWAQGIHDAFSGAGAVQTADTGQINLSTVTVPGTNSDAGYEIWRFDDDDQATIPVYFKLVYGMGSAAGRQRIKISAGLGSDGSGSLTSGSSEATLAFTGAGSSGLGYTAVSYFDDELAMVTTNYSTSGSNNYIMSCAFGRLKNPSGSLEGAGYVYMNVGNNYYLRTGGSWGSATGYSNSNGSIGGGNAIFGRMRPVAWPHPGIGPLAIAPQSMSGGESGELALPDGTVGTFKVLNVVAQTWFSISSTYDRVALRSA